MNTTTHSLDKTAPGTVDLLGTKVAIFFCWGACFRYRSFEQIDDPKNPGAPRYSLKCEGCRFTYPGSWSHVTLDEHMVELRREYGKPYTSDKVYAIAAARMLEAEKWLGYSDPPPGAVLIPDDLQT